MNVLRGSRRIVWIALTLGLAGLVLAGSAPAQARVAPPVLNRAIVAFWGANSGTPANVTGLTGVTQVSAGTLHSLALRSDGTVWAWGRNDLGQLGDGTTVSTEVPVQVTGLSRVTRISAGDDASLATRTNGITALTSVWAWGGNSKGQLGDGTFTNRLTPEQVAGISTPYIAGISAGFQFAVVLGTDGSSWGWGADQSGQLDNARTGNPVTRPLQMTWTGSGITQLSAGYDHVLALRSNGTVLAWGGNSQGQLGDGSIGGTSGLVQVGGLARVSQVSAGGQFSLSVYTPPLVAL
jgi:alpha-tubulin suppressor-like RCC1 family protein